MQFCKAKLNRFLQQFSVLSGGNLTYAEIEHLQKTRKPRIVPRDKSTVLYSEIRVDEVLVT